MHRGVTLKVEKEDVYMNLNITILVVDDFSNNETDSERSFKETGL